MHSHTHSNVTHTIHFHTQPTAHYNAAANRPASPPLDDLSCRDDRLCNSVVHGNTDKLSKLLAIHIGRKDFHIDMTLHHGYNMLMRACQNGQHEIVAILLAHGADPNVSIESYSPLMEACKSTTDTVDAYRIVELLLRKQVPVNQVDRRGLTALMYASTSGNCAIVECLVKVADINMADNEGNTVCAGAQ